MRSGRTAQTTRTAALCAGIATLLLAGCGGNPIVGKWAGTLSVGPFSAPAVAEFKADGTETVTLTAMGQTEIINFTYKTDNGSLTQTIVSATRNGQTVTAPSQGKTQTQQYKIDGDTLTTTLPGSSTPVVLKRQAQ